MSATSKVITGKPRQARGPLGYECFVAVTFGNLVSPGTAGNAGKVGPSAADSVTCLGVATTSALPVGTSNTNTSPSGYPSIDANMPSQYVAIARRGIFALKAGGTLALGDFVKCGAAGTVVKWVAGTDGVEKRVGQVVDSDGAVLNDGVYVDVNIG